MSVSRAVIGLMKDVIGVETHLSENKYNDKTYNALVSYKGRVVYAQKRVLNLNGEVVTSSTQVYIPTTITGFDPQARITLPDGTQPPILSYKSPSWPDGSRHLEIYCS